MSVYGGPNMVVNGLIGLYDFTNAKSYPGSGTSISDLTANGFTMNTVGSPTYQSGYFTGFSDANFLRITGSFPMPGTGDFSYGFWEYVTSSAAVSTLFEITTPSTTLIVRNYFSGNPVYVNNGAVEGSLSFTNNVGLNAWYNLVIARSGTAISGYVNGVKSTNSLTAGNSVTGTTINMGSLSVATGQAFNGRMGSFSAYNRNLTNDEILQNFNALRGRYGV